MHIFKVLADPKRMEILALLKDGERCACKLTEALKLSQPTLSHHMRVLSQAALVHSRKEGRWCHYRLNPEGFKEAKAWIDALLEASLEASA